MKELLICALKEAGKIQKQHFNKVFRFKQKGSISSIVTETDLLCDKTIVDILRHKFPGHNFLSEESGFTSNNSQYTWVIDPLDGTSNFAAGIPWFGVLISLMENSKPILAGAYLPIDEKLYLAELGKGAFLNDKRLFIQNNELKNALFAFSTDYTNDVDYLDRGLKFQRLLIQNTRNLRSTNSLIDFMMVAEGKLGGAVNMFTKIWDIAAPKLIIEEAGGVVKDFDFRKLIFEINDTPAEKNYPVIAGSFGIIDELEKIYKIHPIP